MCGLVGIFTQRKNSALSKFELSTFFSLLYHSAARGQDSTGILLIDGETGINIFKMAETPADFLWSEKFSKWFKRHSQKPLAVFGHTRAATVGEVKTAHAHPFMDGKFMFMHNGGITSLHGINVKECPVDSMAIGKGFVQFGEEETLLRAFGPQAIIWADTETGKFNIYRNWERPLHYVEKYSTTYLASEKGMLDWIMNRGERGGNASSFSSTSFREGILHTYSYEDDKLVCVKTDILSRRYPKSGSYSGNRYTGPGWLSRQFDYDYEGEPFSQGTHQADKGWDVKHKSEQKALPPPKTETTSAVDNATEKLVEAVKETETPKDTVIPITSAKSRGILRCRSVGPFKVDDTILCSPLHYEEIKFSGTANRYRVHLEAMPTDLSAYSEIAKKKIEELVCVLDTHDKEEVNRIEQAKFVNARIISIFYDRDNNSYRAHLVNAVPVDGGNA